MGVKIPLLDEKRVSEWEPMREPLTSWEIGVFAMYQIAVEWSPGTAALLVPHGVAERLLAENDNTAELGLRPEDSTRSPECLLPGWEPTTGEARG